MNKGILRHETIFRKLIPVYDVSDFVKERLLGDIHVFRITDAFEKGSLFIGFGKPNVFICYPEGDNFVKFDAKSLKREPSKLTDTRDIIQSGLFIEILNPTEEMISAVKYSAQEHVGSKNWTCVNSNCRVLEDAGFTSGDSSLSNFYFPIDLIENLIENGLYFKGQRVQFIFKRTVPLYLENFAFEIIKSEWNTLYRHTKRYIKNHKNNNKFAGFLDNFIQKFKKHENKIQLEEKIILFPENRNFRDDFTLIISKPGKMMNYLRCFWGPHAFFEVLHRESNINDLLPEKLTAYKGKKKTFVNLAKQYVLFSKPVVSFIRSNLCDEKECFYNSKESDLYNMIRTHTDNIPNKYNLIITGTSIHIIKNNIQYDIVDWVLSKHVLLSGYSKDVRFAGEFWKEMNGKIYFNNNSGTYTPSKDTLPIVENILKKTFPNVDLEYKQF